MSVNKVILLGNLGQDPEMRHTPSGDPVATCSMATTENWKDKATGEKKEATEWHRLTFWRRDAEIVKEYCAKGSKLYIEGKLKTRSYDKDGSKHYVTEIHVDSFQMLDGAPRNNTQEPERQAAPQRPPSRQPPTASAPQRQHHQAKQNGYAPQSAGFDDGFNDDIAF